MTVNFARSHFGPPNPMGGLLDIPQGSLRKTQPVVGHVSVFVEVLQHLNGVLPRSHLLEPIVNRIVRRFDDTSLQGFFQFPPFVKLYFVDQRNAYQPFSGPDPIDGDGNTGCRKCRVRDARNKQQEDD